MVDKLELIQGLEKAAKLSRSSKLRRYLAYPWKYAFVILVNKIIYPFSKVGKVLECTTFFKQKMKVLLPSGTDIYILGAKSHDSEIRLSRFLIHELKEGDVFFDVGSHFGFFSLLAACVLGEKGRIYAFEASSNNFELLLENCGEVSQIQLFHTAIASIDREVKFYEFPILYSENNTMDISPFENEHWFTHQKPKEVKIAGRALGSLCNEINTYPRLLKIDVEGAEFEVIKGMKSLFDIQRFPIIIMEFWNDPKKNKSHLQALHFLKEYGYKVYKINDEGTLVESKDIHKDFSDSDNIVLKNEK